MAVHMEEDLSGKVVHIRQAFTSRGLVLTELLPQTAHYSGSHRRDALLGILELVQKYPQVIIRHLRTTIQPVLDRVLDVEPSVRSALLSVFRALLAALEKTHGLATFGSFLPLLVLYISSGMSHLDPDVRSDAVLFLALIAAYFPEQLRAHAPTLLSSLLFVATGSHSFGIQNKKGGGGEGSSSSTASASSAVAAATASLAISSPVARASVLDVLSTLVSLSFPSESNGSSHTGMGLVTSSLDVFDPELGNKVGWVQRSDARDVGSYHPFFSPSLASSSKASSMVLEQKAQQGADVVLARLSPLLIQCWLDADPGSRLTQHRASTLLSIVQILTSLTRTLVKQRKPIPAHAVESLRSTYISHFPLQYPSVARAKSGNLSAKAALVVNMVDSINIELIELVALISPSETDLVTPMTSFLTSHISADGNNTALTEKVLVVLPTYTRLLLTRTLKESPATVSAAFPPLCKALQAFLNNPALVTVHPRGIYFAICAVDAIASDLSPPMYATARPYLKAWAGTLFKILWLAKANVPDVSSAILNMFSTWAFQDRGSSELGLAFATSASLVAPLLAVKVKDSVVAGPFVHYTPEMQSATLFLLHRLDAISPQLIDGATYVFHSPSLSHGTVDTLLETLFMCAVEYQTLGPSELVSFFVSALVKGDDDFANDQMVIGRPAKRKRVSDSRDAPGSWEAKLARADLLCQWIARTDAGMSASGAMVAAVFNAVCTHTPLDESGLVLVFCLVHLSPHAPASLGESVGPQAAQRLYDLSFSTSSERALALKPRSLTLVLDRIDLLSAAVEFEEEARKLYLQARGYVARGRNAYL